MTTPTDQELEKVAREWNVKPSGQFVFKLYAGDEELLEVSDYAKPLIDRIAELHNAVLSALKQVQPTKPLVDSIAVSPQEQIPADAQNASTDVREASEDSSDRPPRLCVACRGVIDPTFKPDERTNALFQLVAKDAATRIADEVSFVPPMPLRFSVTKAATIIMDELFNSGFIKYEKH